MVLALMGFDARIYLMPTRAHQQATWLYSGLSPEDCREKDVEKECHDEGDASDHECTLEKSIEAFAGDRENEGIDDSSDECARQAQPQCSDEHVAVLTQIP
jgi:hypothetical protein